MTDYEPIEWNSLLGKTISKVNRLFRPGEYNEMNSILIGVEVEFTDSTKVFLQADLDSVETSIQQTHISTLKLYRCKSSYKKKPKDSVALKASERLLQVVKECIAERK